MSWGWKLCCAILYMLPWVDVTEKTVYFIERFPAFHWTEYFTGEWWGEGGGRAVVIAVAGPFGAALLGPAVSLHAAWVQGQLTAVKQRSFLQVVSHVCSHTPLRTRHIQ
jgi:hypothetical protein